MPTVRPGRLRLLFALFAVASLVLAGRLAYWQAIGRAANHPTPSPRPEENAVALRAATTEGPRWPRREPAPRFLVALLRALSAGGA